MKYVAEYRDEQSARRLADAIAREATRPWALMEVCGGQTHSIVRYGVDGMLPSSIELLHGPGCPVCVTPLETVDRAHAIAAKPGVIFCSYGDMLRVPGSRGDLSRARSEGADVRIVYGPLDALAIARQNPDRQVVFFAHRFRDHRAGQRFGRPPGASAGHRQLQRLGFARAGPACSPRDLRRARQPSAGATRPRSRLQRHGHGSRYEPIAEQYGVPIVITGFEPVDLLEGVLRLVRLLERGQPLVEKQYGRVVRPEGNRQSLELIERVFEVCDRKWRGVGSIPGSGFRLRREYADQNAELRFEVANVEAQESPECISGQVLRGVKKPPDVPHSVSAARRSDHSARRWSRPRALVPRTSTPAAPPDARSLPLGAHERHVGTRACSTRAVRCPSVTMSASCSGTAVADGLSHELLARRVSAERWPRGAAALEDQATLPAPARVGSR